MDKSKLDVTLQMSEVVSSHFSFRGVLVNDYFEFDGKYYKQTIGCSICLITLARNFGYVNESVKDDRIIIFDGLKGEILDFCFDITEN